MTLNVVSSVPLTKNQIDAFSEMNTIINQDPSLVTAEMADAIFRMASKVFINCSGSTQHRNHFD
jgi:hypothetical protein